MEFKNRKQLVSVIDIGSSKAVIIAAIKYSSGTCKIVKVSKLSYKNSETCIDQIEQLALETRKTIQEAESMTKLRSTEIIAGLTYQYLQHSFNRGYLVLDPPGKKIDKKDISELTSMFYTLHIPRTMAVLNVIPTVYNIDDNCGIRSPIGMHGHRLEGRFHILCAKKSVINLITRGMTFSGLNIKEFVLDSIANAKAVIPDTELKKWNIVIDIGSENSSLAIYSEGIHQYNEKILFGGNYITRAIMKKYSLKWKEAEITKLKYRYDDISSRELAKTINKSLRACLKI